MNFELFVSEDDEILKNRIANYFVVIPSFFENVPSGMIPYKNKYICKITPYNKRPMTFTSGIRMKFVLLSAFVMLLQIGHSENILSQNKSEILKPDSLVYKVIDTTKLVMEFSYPRNVIEGTKYPAIVFFFGGGWKGGTIDQFKPHAKFFAERGMIGIVVDYRVRGRQGTTPFEAVKDAKSAIRFLREHANELQIDPDRIVASGGSAGGHLAAATGIISGLEEENEDLRVSSKPNALVLFNPVFDNGPNGYGYDRIGDRYREISPLHNISAGDPPTVVFLGTNDKLIPVSTAEDFKRKMEKNGNRCDLFLYEGQNHGFFNDKHPVNYRKTLMESARFLESLGYIRNLTLYDLDRMFIAKELADQGKEPFASEVKKLQKKADEFMAMKPVSVMDKEIIPPGGNKHDYYSLGPYWWPDPDKDDGLPYIRRDGIRNPETSKYDTPALDKMSKAVFNLTLAWVYTGDDKYAFEAGKWLRAWFLDPETRMKPNLEYGQAIPGITEGRGIGIIETNEFINVAEAISILDYSNVLTQDERSGLTEWYRSYNHWLLTSEKGWDERMWPNNHGTSYDAQVATFAIFTNDEPVASMILDSVKIKRIETQFEADGSQPLELKRTKAMGYSIYNLTHYARIATIAENYGMDLWHYENSKGGSIIKGIKYLIPFLTGEKEFPYQQLGGIESQITPFKELLRMNPHGWNDPEISRFLEKYKDIPYHSEFVDLIYPVFE